MCARKFSCLTAAGGLASILLFLLAGMSVHLGAATPKPGNDPHQLVSEVIQNELTAHRQDHTYWRYRELDLVNGKRELRDVFATKYGVIDRLLAVDGRPLSVQREQTESERINNLLAHPAEIRERMKKQHEDDENSQNLLKVLPEAFTYQEDSRDGDLIKLAFKPNPTFRPSSHQAQVFHQMDGFIWIDSRQMRLARMDGRLTSEVKFGGGLFGHLDAGGRFSVKVEDVGAGHWEMTLLDVRMNGKVLFFKTIGVRQMERLTNYEPLQGEMTLQQAAQALSKDSVGSAQAAVASERPH
jgi:hypothetical protein